MNAIDEFLDTWWGDTMDWYLNKFREFKELFSIKKELQDEFGYHTTRPNQVTHPSYNEACEDIRKFLNNLGDNVKGLVQMTFYYDNQHMVNPDKISAYDFLADILQKEKDRKKKALIAKIVLKAGNIIDATALRIGHGGNLDGIVIGDKATVRINTISAGGYNIQCFHFRVLVKIIK